MTIPVFARISVVTLLLAVPTEAMIINLHGVNNCRQNPVTVACETGTYHIDPIGIADGGKYDAVSLHYGQSGSWRHTYTIESDQFDRISADTGYCANAREALAKGIHSSFTLTAPANVSFYIWDGPNGSEYRGDNQGGISLRVTAEEPPVDLHTGLVAYYPFDGNANDASGNGNHGVIHGATLARSTRMGGAYYFDGRDYISASATNLPTAERTVALWFNAETVSNRPNLIGYGGDGHGTSWLMGINHWGQSMMSVSGHFNRHTLKYWYTEPPVGQWYHYAITTSSAGTKIYVNGELKASNNDFINDTQVANTDLAIGVAVSTRGRAPYTDGNVGYFKGAIDEVRIYDRELSGSEIMALWKAEPTEGPASDYTATVQADIDTALAGTPVVFTGHAVRALGDQPASDVDVVIHITTKGTERTVTVRTDESGDFRTVWQPLAREAGHYFVAADHPEITRETPEDEFVLLGADIEPQTVSHTIVTEETVEASAAIRNLGDTELSGLSARIENASAGFVVEMSPPETLAPEAISRLDYSITAVGPSGQQAEFELVLSVPEGDVATLRVQAEAIPSAPALAAWPSPINAAMVPGKQTLVDFTVTNVGGTATGRLEIRLPGAAWLSLATPTYIASLDPNESTTATLILTPDQSLLLGPYHGHLVVAGTNLEIKVPFQFNCISEAIGNLKVTVVDEFTYYGEGKPKVAGAEVTVTDPHTGELVASGLTADNGEIVFFDLTEAYYDVQVRADDHGDFKTTTRIPAGRTAEITAFLPRELVSYRWTVVPTTVEDRYDFTIEAVFETHVPAPVVTVDPVVVDLRQMESETMQVDYTFTNHGLIAANDFSLHFENHPRYDFKPLVDDIGDIPAMSSVVVPVLITDRSKTQATASATQSVPCEGGDPFGLYYILCGGKSYRRVTFYYVTEGSSSFGTIIVPYGPGGYGPSGYWGINGGGTGGGTGSVIGPTYWLGGTSLCDNDCFWDFSDCITGILGLVLPPVFSVTNSILECLAACSQSNLDDPDEQAVCAEECTSLVLSPDHRLASAAHLFRCLNAILSCMGHVDTREPLGMLEDRGAFVAPLANLRSQASEEATASLQEHMGRVQTILDPVLEILGDPKWLYLDEGTNFDSVVFDDWLIRFHAAVQSDSDEGSVISMAEQNDLVGGPMPLHVTSADVQKAIDRWNRTMTYWSAGIFNADQVPEGSNLDFIDYDRFYDELVEAQIAEDLNAQDGFPGLFDGIDASLVSLYDATEAEVGICVRVRIQINQAAVVSRDAFTATLELINESDTVVLEQVGVRVKIADERGSPSEDLFGIHPPELDGLDSVDGDGTLPAGTSGTAQWLIVPSGAAAPNEPTLYYVSGELSYVSNGNTVRIPLYPAPIAVLPCPNLHVKYFLEREVYSDDPFTTDIVEPAVPFALGLMMSNSGAGTARDVHVVSSQPTIIENEKGLLIEFKIIGAQVGAEAVSPSLSVDFGDIAPDETAVAQWLLVSSLQGRFVEYEARFVHVDGLGDQRLSLVDSIEIHELQHVVRATYPDDDGVPDFLANDVKNLDHLPDTLHCSDGTVAPVTALVYERFDGTPLSNDFQVTVTVPDTPERYFYARWPAPDFFELPLVSVTRSDGVAIRVEDNVWTTRRIIRKQGRQPYEESLLHLFDCGGPGTYTLNFMPCDGPILKVTSTAGGSVTVPGEGEFCCSPCEEVLLVAEADPGYYFSRWSGSAVLNGMVADSNSPNTIATCCQDTSVTAEFEPVRSAVYDVSLDTDPGWTLEGQWEFGVPLGQRCGAWGNNDPTSGHTGQNVVGVNLAGCYDPTVAGTYCATAGPFDLSDYTDISLQFWRWLNSDIPEYAKASVEASTDGRKWTILWTQPESQAVTDTEWTRCEYPIPGAGGQPTVYLRWSYEIVANKAYAYTGWNIDDVQLIGCVECER